MNQLPVYLTDNALCNQIAAILTEKTGESRRAVWKRACILAGYIRDKRDLTHSLKCNFEWIDRHAPHRISVRLDQRLDQIFSRTYKSRAKRFD